MERQQFTFYASFYNAISKIPQKERLKVYESICRLGLFGEDTSLDGIAGAVFELAKPNILAGNKKALNRLQTENKAKTNEEQNENKTTTKRKEEEGKGKEKEKVKEQMLKENNKRKVFRKPSLEEIKAYVQERNSNVDPQRFMDHYESCGWKVGNKAMVDWKAAVRTWEHNGYDKPKKEPVYIAPAQKATNNDIENMKRLMAEMKGE